jgi:hypothetical protein
MVKRTSYEAPHSAVFFTLSPLTPSQVAMYKVVTLNTTSEEYSIIIKQVLEY